jgi:hypothetical protein
VSRERDELRRRGKLGVEVVFEDENEGTTYTRRATLRRR